VPLLSRDEILRLRCSEHDWTIWQSRAKTDEIWRQTGVHKRRVDAARLAFDRFVSGPSGYIGISWGKDSTAILALALEIGCDWPLVHVKLEPVGNPDCDMLRDQWFARYPEIADRYYEIVIRCQTKQSTNRYDTNAAYAAGFALARKRFGERRVSGVRAEEAAIRKMTMRRLGQGDEDDKSAPPFQKDRTGALVIKGYAPKRWTFADLADATRPAGTPAAPAKPAARDSAAAAQAPPTPPAWELAKAAAPTGMPRK
jgi:hypothetical protein